MKIEESSWHYRVYCWFTGRHHSQVNLCPYVRTVFLWAPLRFLFGDGKIGRFYVAAFVWPAVLTSAPLIAWHFNHHAAGIILIVYAGIATFVGVVTGGPFLMRLAKERREKLLLSKMTEVEVRRYHMWSELPERLQPKRLKAIKQAWHLLCEYASAAHQKVCPLLTVDGNANTANEQGD